MASRKKFFIILTIAIGVVFPIDSTPLESKHCLSPKSSLHSPIEEQNKSLWETLIQTVPNYYVSGELKARVQALKKALPIVKELISSRMNLSEDKILAIFATGNYILDPSWNVSVLPEPPEFLDFIVVVDPSAWTLEKTTITIKDVEILPESFFDKEDLGYQSAYHCNLIVTINKDMNSPENMQAYYLGQLLEGSIDWQGEPNLNSFIKLIQSLLYKSLNKGFFDLVVGTKDILIAKLLISYKVSASFQTQFAELQNEDLILYQNVLQAFSSQMTVSNYCESSL